MTPSRGKSLAHLHLFCKARPLMRPRFANGDVYQPKENQRALYNEVAEYFEHVNLSEYEYLWVEIDIRFKKENNDKLFPIGRGVGDIDNLQKGILDALVKCTIIRDDANVVYIRCNKLYGEEDYIGVKIYEAKERGRKYAYSGRN